MSRPAHRLSAKSRTSDVTVSEDVTFAGLLLSEPVLQGLKRAGFERPSPIQLRAIPLGRCAVDLIVQAKSGTGKTCVLAVLALETLVSAPPSGRCRALVLAPTREVAVQVAQVITAIGAHVPGLSVHSLIGGLPLAQDVANLRRCNVAVGTPGRVRQLVDCGALNTDSVRLFVMDEADKLMEDAFVDDINFIYSTLPASKQMIALSATYPESLADLLARYMRSPTFVRLGKTSPALLGIRQYVMTVAHEPLVTKQLKIKLDALLDVLSTVSFTQCLVFSNHQTRAETLCSQLSARGWPSAHLSSSLTQERRLEALSQLTELRCRVLVTTDLGARGVDSEHADLVVQLDVPWDGATYLHRVGRAGRYGSLGAAIALVSRGEEERRLTTVLAAAGVRPLLLPAALPADLKTCSTDGWQTYGGDGGAAHGGGDGAEGKTGQVRSNGHSTSPGAGKSRADPGRRRASPPAESGAGEHAAAAGGGGGGGGGGGEGRKTLVARRRQPPGPPSAEQRQDRARLEAATDGWTRAVTSRGKREPAAAAAAPAAAEPARPPAAPVPTAAGDSSGRTERTEASGDEGSDSDDSQDSFQAMLRAYKRDQQRRAADEANAGSDGHQGTQSEETGEKVTPEETRSGETNQKVTSSGEGKRMSMNGVENKDSKDPTPSAAEQERAESSAPREEAGAVPVDSDPGSDAELSVVDEEALRLVLRKLTPRLVGSLTEEELQRTLAPYLTARRRSGCRLYRRAVALVRQKGARRALQLALGSGRQGEEVGLSELLERLCVVEPAPPAAPPAAPSAVKVPSADSSKGARRAESSRPSPRLVNGHADRTSRASDTRADVSSRGEAAARKPKVGASPVAAQSAYVKVRDSSQQRSSGPKGGSAATCTAPSTNGAATYSASPAARAVVDYDEEVLQMPNREEDVEAFQRDLRLSAAHKKALRASGRSAGRQKTAAAADSSRSESSSASVDNIPPQKPVRRARGGRNAARQHQTRAAQASAASVGAATLPSEGEYTAPHPQSGAPVYGEAYADPAGGAAAAWGWSHEYHQPPWSQWPPYGSGAYLPRPPGPGWWGDSAAHPPVYGTAPGWGGGWSPHMGRQPQHPPRTWDELLNMCYDQQSRYLAHMSSYYAQYYGRTQT